MRRCVYIVESPLAARDVERFGMAVLQRHGFTVEVWEVDALFLPGSRHQALIPATGVAVTTVTTVEQLRSLAATLRPDDVVVAICGYYRDQAESHATLRTVLAEAPAKVAAVAAGSRPTRPAGIRSAARAVSADPRLLPWELKSEAARLLTAVRGSTRRSAGLPATHHLDWAFVGTDASDLDPSCIGPGTQVVPIHSFDFDRVLDVKATPAEAGRNLVFLDSMGPLHPDYESLGLRRGKTTTQEYFAIVCSVLAQVEKLAGLPVVIAAHPRATPGLLEPHYQGRTLAYGQTPALLSTARAVLMAFPSTATGMAVVFRRPLTLIVSRKFDPFVREDARAYSAHLPLNTIDADKQLKSWKIPVVSEEAYAGFESRYVRVAGTPLLPFWEVVARSLDGRDLHRP